MDAITCWCCDRLVAREAHIYAPRVHASVLQPGSTVLLRMTDAALTFFAACWVLLQLGLRVSMFGLLGYLIVFLLQAALSFHL